jgi:hypothetical protein
VSTHIDDPPRQVEQPFAGTCREVRLLHAAAAVISPAPIEPEMKCLRSIILIQLCLLPVFSINIWSSPPP